MPDKTPLIWHSNAPFTGTGYGAQSALFLPRLKDHYRLVCSAYYGLEGNMIPWNGIPVLGGVSGDHGNLTIAEHAKAVWGKDERDKGLIVTLMDVWVLDPHTWADFNVASWVPVDHEPAPGPVKGFFQMSGAVPIAMSRFGEKQLEEFDPLYVPHAVDTEILRPIPQAQARQQSGMDEDAFIVGMVAANKGNPSRKCFAEAFLAFKDFHAEHPEAKLYLHTELSGRFQGVDLRRLMKDVGIPEKAVVACDQYRAVHYPFDLETMANVYSSFDVLLAPSAGEGFGIPVVEAQACGVPVIVSNFSAQPELVGAGWTVSGHKTYTPIGSWQFVPSVPDILDRLEKAYETRGEHTDKARKFSLQYDADLVTEKFMLPALKKVAERFEERKPVQLKAAA